MILKDYTNYILFESEKRVNNKIVPFVISNRIRMLLKKNKTSNFKRTYQS